MKLKDRISKFTKDDWIIIGFAILMVFVGLYFSIAMTVSLSNGLTLFGNSENSNTKEVEVLGPTGSDILVVVIIWVLTAVVLGFVVFKFFFRKQEKKEIVHKEVVNGKTVYLMEEPAESEEKEEKE